MRKHMVSLLVVALLIAGLCVGLLYGQEEEGTAESQTCPLCQRELEAEWRYCPHDGVLLPGKGELPGLPGASDQATRIVFEYADGSQRIYSGDQARKVLEAEAAAAGFYWTHFPDKSPYEGLRYTWVGPDGTVEERTIPGANSPLELSGLERLKLEFEDLKEQLEQQKEAEEAQREKEEE